MKTIELTQGYSTVVDDHDYESLNRYRWKILKAGKKLYASRTKMLSGRKSTTILMHRAIAVVPDGLLVDHKDGDGLNNCRSNIRVTVQSHNLANMSSKGGSSRFKGVHWSKKDRKWVAQISAGYRNDGRTMRIFLGNFDSEIDAAWAYDRRALAIHGEFALLNFPRPDGMQKSAALMDEVAS